MDPRIERKGLTEDRRTQAVLTARAIMKSYGPSKAMGRVEEMSATREEHTAGNAAFYGLVRDLVREAIDRGTIDGGPIA